MSATGIDNARFESSMALYRGTAPRDDKFADYGAFLKDRFAKDKLNFVSKEQLAKGPNELLDWSRRIVQVSDKLLTGKPMALTELEASIRAMYTATIQFGSTAIGDYEWSKTNPDLGADDLISRRGDTRINWLEWEMSQKKLLREKTLNAKMSSQDIINEMKAIELTGDPITATADARATPYCLT